MNRSFKSLGVPIGIGLAAAVVQLGAVLLGEVHGYGYFIDELYYLACARRLDFGFVDHPPLAPAVLRATVALLGDTILAIRVPVAIAAALTAIAAGWLAARLGAGRFGQALASICAVGTPISLVMFSFFSMNAFEIVFWTALLVVAVLLVERSEPKLWVVFGVLAGLALENKHTVVPLAGGIVLGLALTRERKLLFTRWLLVGGAIAFLLFLPNLLWQIDNGSPSLEFYRNATLLKNQPTPPFRVISNQILFMNPLMFPVWAAGLYFCFRRRPALRFVAIAYLLALGSLALSQSSRPDRIAGFYPALFALGSIEVERLVRSTTARALALATVVAGSAVLGGISLPVLPPESVSRLAAFLGIDTQIERGAGKRAELPQWLADRFGWEELVEQVRAVYEALPEEERRRAVILAPSYGHAGAIELLGGGNLPSVLSPHNHYYLWGRDGIHRLEGGVLISIGYGTDAIGPMYESVEQVAIYDCDYCMTWRDEMPIYVARGFRLPRAELEPAWEAAKNYQ